MKFRFFPHTADARFRAYGKTLEEAFSNSALAAFSLIVKTSSVDKKILKEISIDAPDLEGLLYRFLEKILYFLDVDFFLLSDVKRIKIFEKNNKFFLSAELIGDKFNEGYEQLGSVKAVTYNQMFVKKIKGKYITQVVLDL